MTFAPDTNPKPVEHNKPKPTQFRPSTRLKLHVGSHNHEQLEPLGKGLLQRERLEVDRGARHRDEQDLVDLAFEKQDLRLTPVQLLLTPVHGAKRISFSNGYCEKCEMSAPRSIMPC